MPPRRPLLVAFLVLAPLVSWAWIVTMARDMYGPMTGASAWLMTPAWDARHLVLLWAMWAVMMTAMMLPSAIPFVLLAGRSGRPLLLALGYLAAWSLFSVGATMLQWALVSRSVLTPMMEPSSRIAGALLLLVAGVYQWTPFKRACLTTCQSPMAFVMRRWRSGRWGSFRMGAEHGAYCVGCCWALMLLLFAGGVMNLAVIASLTVFVAFEKLLPIGEWGSRISGAALVGLAAWLVAR